MYSFLSSFLYSIPAPRPGHCRQGAVSFSITPLPPKCQRTIESSQFRSAAPLSVLALSAAFGGTVAVPCFLLRPSLRACKKQTAALLRFGCFIPQDAPQLRSPATRGRLPSQSRRPCGRLASSPAGRAKFTPVGKEKLCGKTKFFSFALPQTSQRLTQVRLPPPAGEVAQRFAL